MTENDNKYSRFLVIFAALSIIGVIVIGARWSGVELPSFRSELDRPILEIEIDPDEPPEDTPPWELGQRRSNPPYGNLSEFDLCVWEARNNLPQFANAISSPTPTQSDFCVLVNKPSGNSSDVFVLFWFRVVRTTPGRFSATILPVYDRQRYADEFWRYRSCEIADVEILDWLYFDDGKMVGGYTAGYFHRNR